MSTSNDHLFWSAQSHPGRKRATNEDRFLALTIEAQTYAYLGKFGQQSLVSTDCVFAVSDGMGGASAGEFASRIAVDKIARWIPRGFRTQAQLGAAGFSDLFLELYTDIHRALLYLGANDPDCQGMGATLSLAWFTPQWMYFAHLGDSRIYYRPAGQTLRLLTHDDTYVGWLERTGRITEREARTHPQRKALQRALGAQSQFVDPQVGAVGISPGDRFLLCSDGLVDGLWHHQIEDSLRDDQPLHELSAEHLVEQAVSNSGDDNATAIVIEVRAGS